MVRRWWEPGGGEEGWVLGYTARDGARPLATAAPTATPWHAGRAGCQPAHLAAFGPRHGISPPCTWGGAQSSCLHREKLAAELLGENQSSCVMSSDKQVPSHTYLMAKAFCTHMCGLVVCTCRKAHPSWSWTCPVKPSRNRLAPLILISCRIRGRPPSRSTDIDAGHCRLRQEFRVEAVHSSTKLAGHRSGVPPSPDPRQHGGIRRGAPGHATLVMHATDTRA